MNQSIVYRRCQQVVETMLNEGYDTAARVKWNDIEGYVAMSCGADPRTLEKYRHYLVYFGFFKQVRATIFQWCERDRFNNPVKAHQTDLGLLRVLNQRRAPRSNY